jgi:hypothetical protein
MRERDHDLCRMLRKRNAVVAAGSTLTVAPGESLTIESGTLTVDAGGTLTVEENAGLIDSSPGPRSIATTP